MPKGGTRERFVQRIADVFSWRLAVREIPLLCA
jgi:hypothetical protein